MQKQKTSGLPCPKWCFVTLAVPTFYMPISCLILAVWTIGGMLWGEVCDPPGWLMNLLYPAVYVTVAMWPVYVVWVGLSKILTWREKGWWLFVVVLLNMVGMPMFYIFMIRRYLGIEGRTGKRDEMALESLLLTCRLEKESLSLDQLNVLRSYCRKRRIEKYGLVPMILLSGFLFYTALVFVPKNCLRLFSSPSPTRVVIIDSASDTRKEIAPDPEIKNLYVQNIMIFGVMAGAMGAMGLFALAQAIAVAKGSWHRKAFIEYLQVTEGENLENE